LGKSSEVLKAEVLNAGFQVFRLSELSQSGVAASLCRRTPKKAASELDEERTFSILEHVGNDGRQTYLTKFCNLAAILKGV